MAPGTMKLSRFIAGKGEVSEIPQPTFRQGKVVNVTSAGVATVTIGDDETWVETVGSDVNYVPRLDDSVILRITDDEVYIDGMAGTSPIQGVFRGLSVATSVTTSQSRGATTFGNLATVGPTTTVTVGPSGILIVVFSAQISTTSDNDGGVMGTALSGANTVAAEDARALVFYPKINGAIQQMSRVSLYAGLTPGDTVVTCQYRDIIDVGTDVFFANRRMFALPL